MQSSEKLPDFNGSPDVDELQPWQLPALENRQKSIELISELAKLGYSEGRVSSALAEIENGQTVVDSKLELILHFEDIDSAVGELIRTTKEVIDTIDEYIQLLDSRDSRLFERIGLGEKLRYQGVALLDSQERLIRGYENSLTVRQFAKAKRNLEELKQTLLSSENVWQLLVESEVIPPEINQNISYLLSNLKLARVVEKTQQITGLDSRELKLLRAAALEEFAKGESETSTIDPTVLLDIINGKFDENDPWLSGNLLESFRELEDYVEKSFSTLKIRQKTALGLLMVLLFVTLTTTPSSKPRYTTYTPYVVSSTEQYFEGNNHSDYGDMGGSILESDSILELPDSVEAPPAQPGISKSLRPENSEEPSPFNYWEIKGSIPRSYFRTNVFYEYRYHRWEDTSSSERDMELFPSEKTGKETTIMTSVFEVNQLNDIDLPVSIGDEVTFVQIDTLPGMPLWVTYSASQDGVYRLILHTDSERITNLPSESRIVYGLAPFQDIDAEGHVNTLYDDDPLLQRIDELPDDVLAELESIKDLETDSQKAFRIQRMIQSRFTYSLDSRYSKYFHSGYDSEFILRAFEAPFADCDVANTVAVALLRYVGVDARLAVGFSNQGSSENQILSSFNKSSRLLEGSESHGWAEYWDNETKSWVVVDSTPPSSVSDGIQNLINLLKLDKLKIDRFDEENYNIVSGGLKLLGYLLAAGMTVVWDKRVRKRSRKIRQEAVDTMEELLGIEDDQTLDAVYRIMGRYLSNYRNVFGRLKEEKFPGAWEKTLTLIQHGLFLTPLKTLAMRKKVNQVDSKLDEVHEGLVTNANDVNLCQALVEEVGVDQKVVREQAVKINLGGYYLHGLQQDFRGLVTDIGDKSPRIRVRLVSEIDLDRIFKKTKKAQLRGKEREEVFLEEIVHQLYKRYNFLLRKEKVQSLFKQNTEENLPAFQDKDVDRGEEELSLEEFAEILAPSFVKALYFFRVRTLAEQEAKAEESTTR